MATRHQMPARRTGRQVRRGSNRSRLVVIFLGLLALVLVGSVSLIGQRSSEQRAATNLGPIVPATAPTPPNAEPNGRAWGPSDAPIQVIEYADYECEACGYFARTYEAQFIEAFASTGKVRFEIRNAPFHGEGSRNAAEAAYCAAEQNAFWTVHDTLFLNQPQIEGTGPQVFSKARLNEMAGAAGLDTQAFSQCLASSKYASQVEADFNATVQNNVTRTPTFVVNGQVFPGVISVDEFRRIFAQVAPDVQLAP